MDEHPSPSCLEVRNTEKQPDSTCVLTADRNDLLLAVGLSEEQSCLRLWRSDDDPSFRTSAIRRRRRVLGKLEPQSINEEPDGIVVVLDDQGGVLDVHAPTVGGLRSAQLRVNRSVSG